MIINITLDTDYNKTDGPVKKITAEACGIEVITTYANSISHGQIGEGIYDVLDNLNEAIVHNFVEAHNE